MKRTCKDIIEHDAALLNRALAELKPPEGTTRGEWLKLLYETSTQRFLSDNSRIWSTGAVMIPFSLAPFAVLLSLKDPQAKHLFILASASIGIYVAWLVIADGHRRFQNKSFAWLLAIQQEIGLKNTGPWKLGDYLLTKYLPVRKLRYLILLTLMIGWWIAYSSWPPVSPLEAEAKDGSPVNSGAQPK